MKKAVTFFTAWGLCFFFSLYPVWMASSAPAKGGVLPPISLPIPESPAEKAYLGLTGGGRFEIPSIKARVVIIEIFSMYCPYCQKDAPGINELYQAMENNSQLKGKIKVIGIGAGNSPYEVEVFKKTYQVPFPLFPDGDFTIHKALGDVRTPYFLAIKIDDNGRHQVIHSEVGGFAAAAPFLENILQAAGLK